MKTLVHWLGSRWGSLLTVAFALVNKGIFVLLISTIGRDKIIQLHITENFLAGRGLGLLKYSANELSNPVFESFWAFPPGYSFLISPLLIITGHNYYLSSVIFDLAATVALLFVLRWLCKTLLFPPILTNILTLVFGCFQYTFFLVMGPTDIISLVFIFGGIVVLIKQIQKKQESNPLNLVLIGVIFFMPSLFRYMYIPVSLLIPVSLMLLGFQKKEPGYISDSAWILAVTFSLSLILLSVMNIHTFSPLRQHGEVSGFFLTNASDWYPFIPESFINLDFLSQRIIRFTNLEYETVLKIIRITNIFLFAGILLLLTFKNKEVGFQSHLSKPFKLFLFFGGWIIAGTIILLFILSIVNSKQNFDFDFRTYLLEPRYFSFIILFIQFAFLGWAYYTYYQKKSVVLKFFIGLSILALTIECLHGVYYNKKILTDFKQLKAKQNNDAHWRYFFQYTNDLKKSNPDAELLVASTSVYFNHLALLAGGKGIYDPEELNHKPLSVNKKSILLVIIADNARLKMDGFIKNSESYLATNIENIAFYSKVIYP